MEIDPFSVLCLKKETGEECKPALIRWIREGMKGGSMIRLRSIDLKGGGKGMDAEIRNYNLVINEPGKSMGADVKV